MSLKNPKPNIIFILSDQQRWDTLGCYGQPLDVTPNLDRMAEDGVRFTHTFSCQPVCGPVRSTLQTGKYPTETGCFRNAISLPQDEKTIAHYLREAGYSAGYIGKWHLASTSLTLHHTLESTPESDDNLEAHYESSPVPPERRGGYADYWMAADVMEFTSHGYDGFVFDKDMNRVDFTGFRADALTDFALDFIEENGRPVGGPAGDNPFFLFLSFVEPHHQNDHHHYEGPKGSKDKFKDFVPPADLVGKPGDWKDEYPDYLGCCEALDRNVGRILERLGEIGLDENTLVLYASDHGSHFRTRNRDLEDNCYDDYKRSCHEASIRVPLIIRGPGFRGGLTVEKIISSIDFPTTILKAAGIERPAGMHGRHLQDLTENTGSGPCGDWQDEVFIQISESQVGRAIRTKKWKYSVRAPGLSGIDHPGSDVYTEDCLYDLEADPWESRNLAADPAFQEVRSLLAGRLKERMKEAGEPLPEIRPATLIPD